MIRKRKYSLSSLPEEAKNMLSLNEMVLFDQIHGTLSKEDQESFRYARAKISKYMHSKEVKANPPPPRQRIDYNTVSECLWKALHEVSRVSVEECKQLLLTRPKQFPDNSYRTQRLSLGQKLRCLTSSFFYHERPFNVDSVAPSTWQMLDNEFPCSKLLIETHPRLLNQRDKDQRRLAMAKLREFFVHQPSAVLIFNFKLNNRQVYIYYMSK